MNAQVSRQTYQKTCCSAHFYLYLEIQVFEFKIKTTYFMSAVQFIYKVKNLAW